MNAALRIIALFALASALVLTASCSSGSKSKNATPTGNATQAAARSTTPSGAAAAGQPGQATAGATLAAGASPQASDAAADVPPDANATAGTPAYEFSSPEPPAPFTPAPPPPASTPVAGATPAPPTPPSSPSITIGAASVVAGAVHIPIGIVGTGLAPYTAFNVHLRWDPGVFKFSSANSGGTILPGSVFCPPVQTDADGNGAILGCTALNGNQTTSGGLLATFILTPAGTGCSALHFFTYQGADNGDGGTGTYTMDKDTKVQITATIDGRIDQAGQSC